MREDLLKDWGDLLEKWDGKDRSRPSKLIKLCRKVCDIRWILPRAHELRGAHKLLILHIHVHVPLLT